MSKYVELDHEDNFDIPVELSEDNVDIDLNELEAVVVPDDKKPQTKVIVPTKERQEVTADVGFKLDKTIVEPIPDKYNDTSDATATVYDIANGKTAYTKEGLVEGLLIDRLQWKCDNMQTLEAEFKGCESLELEEILKGLDVSNVKNFKYFLQSTEITSVPYLKSDIVETIGAMCNGCTKLKIADLSGLTGTSVDANTVFSGCQVLTTVKLSPNLKVRTMGSMFYYAYALETVETLNLINITTGSIIPFGNSKKITNFKVINVRVSLKIGAGSGSSYNDYGYLLTDESLINTAKELWDLTDGTSQTLTVSTTSNARFDAIYVKLIDITDEMRAEDEFIDNKKPCEVCESTDEGAMSLREYVVSKNWALA